METVAAFPGGRLIVALGDITDFRGDAIVNAANSGLLGGGGVDGAIHRAAGPELLEACAALRAGELKDGLAPGRAVATTAGRLPFSGVIHTVGPIWAGGSRGEADILAAAYESSLSVAAERGWGEVAFPAISTGVYGYPREEAAKVAYAAISRFLASNRKPERVTLVFYKRVDADQFLSATAGYGAR